jgi:hypothetical protein
MRTSSTLVCLLLSLIALLGCARPEVVARGVTVERDKWCFSTFIGDIDSWPYDMPEPRHAALLKGYESLAIGQSKNEVKRHIGAPDAESFSTMRSGTNETHTSSWAYYVHREEAELARPGDKAVFVEFTSAGMLLRASACNLDLPEMEREGQHPHGR